MKFIGDALIGIMVLIPAFMLVSGYYRTGDINWPMFAVWAVVTVFAVIITYTPRRKG